MITSQLLMEDGVVGIQIVRTLSEEEASSDDEDDEDEGFTIEIVRDKPLPYPEVCADDIWRKGC